MSRLGLSLPEKLTSSVDTRMSPARYQSAWRTQTLYDPVAAEQMVIYIVSAKAVKNNEAVLTPAAPACGDMSALHSRTVLRTRVQHGRHREHREEAGFVDTRVTGSIKRGLCHRAALRHE